MITIKSVDASGKLDAAYANPSCLPFAKAEAWRGGACRIAQLHDLIGEHR